MNKNRPVKSARDRRLYVICPTLDMMLASCDNVKKIAYDSGLDYSNFVKTCKFQRDIRLSTYQDVLKLLVWIRSFCICR